MEQVQVQDQEKAAAGRLHFQFPTAADGYKILYQIGVSDHSVVYKAICESANSAKVAVKVIDVDRHVDEFFVVKTNSLSLIDHANILSPHCCFIVDRRLWIVMPFIHAGPLQAILANRFPNGLPDQFLAILLHQLLRSLICLHELGYIHRDIKASNIFVDSEGSVKLSDLNVASIGDDDDDDDDSSVPYWVPPDEEYSFKSDVWAIGIVALEVAYGCPPISDSRTIRSQLLNISRRFPYNLNLDKMSSKSVIDRKFGELFKDFVSSCLVKDPSKRPSAASLLSHPFIKKGETSNVLFKSIAKDMAGIEDRFEKNKDRFMELMKKDLKVDENRGKIVKVSGWDFNNFLFELEPDEESLGKRVRFRGETIIPLRDDQASLNEAGGEASKFNVPLLLKRMDSLSLSSLSGRIGSRTEEEIRVMDNETLAKVLTSLVESIDQQREVIMMVISQFGRLLERDLEMTKEIKKLKAEVAYEKERSFQLELDYEVLKLKLPDSEDEDNSEN